MNIEALSIDSREPEKFLTMLQEVIMERRTKTGLGTKMRLPTREILEHGDIMIEVSFTIDDFRDGKNTYATDIPLTGIDKMRYRIVIERKTISDALGNWNTSKKSAQSTGHAKNRFDIQAYDMLEWSKCDWGMMLIEDCYEPKHLYKSQEYQSHKASFLQHLNSMADSALPVIRTKSMKDTCIYISHLCERILQGEFQTFKRPLVRIDMGDNIVSMFGNLPDVGEELARRTKAHFIDKFDPFTVFSKACREHLNIVIKVNAGVKNGGLSKAAGIRDSPLCKIDGIGWTKAFLIADSVCNWTKGV